MTLKQASELVTSKLCKDCKHYFKEAVFDDFGLAYEDKCSRLAVTEDLVRGGSTNYPLRNCHWERRPHWIARLIHKDRCGPEGKYFERK